MVIIEFIVSVPFHVTVKLDANIDISTANTSELSQQQQGRKVSTILGVLVNCLSC